MPRGSCSYSGDQIEKDVMGGARDNYGGTETRTRFRWGKKETTLKIWAKTGGRY